MTGEEKASENGREWLFFLSPLYCFHYSGPLLLYFTIKLEIEFKYSIKCYTTPTRNTFAIVSV